MSEAILALFRQSPFDAWVFDNPALSICLLLLISILGYYFWPFVLSIFAYLRYKRLVWKWRLLRGRQMSKRTRDKALADALYDFMLDRINKGEMTHKDKRRYLRNMEMVFELEPGTLTPRPSIQERKRRSLGKLSTEGAKKFTDKVSASKPAKRLISLMTGKA